MTEPPFNIERIRDDLNQRKARTPKRVLTPGRRRKRRQRYIGLVTPWELVLGVSIWLSGFVLGGVFWPW